MNPHDDDGRAARQRLFVRMAIGAVVLLVLIAATGGGGAAIGADAKPLTEVVIASDLPLTGSSRAQTESMVQAIRMRVDEGFGADAPGDVKVTYRSLDDATAQAGKWDEAKCADNMNGLAQDPKVVVVIGPMNSGCAQIQLKTSNTAGLPIVSPAATAVGLTKKGGSPGEPEKYYPSGQRTFLRVTLSDDMQALGGATWAKELGVRTVFVLNDRETYGKGLADQFATAATKLGITVADNEGIDPMASNYRALVPKIVASGAQLVYFGGITQNNAGQILKDLRAGSPKIMFMGPDGIFEDSFVESAGTSGEGAMATFGGIPPEKLEGKGKAFVQAFRKKFGPPQAYTAYAYDAAGIAMEAIERCAAAKGVTRACVLDELFETRDHDGALGTFSMTKTGDSTLSVLSGVHVKRGAWTFSRKIQIASVGGSGASTATGEAAR